MTPPPMTPEASLEALIKRWRSFAAGKVVTRDDYYDGQRASVAKCADELEAAIQSSGRTGWQPIETAPKDSDVLLYSAKEGVRFGYWDLLAPPGAWFAPETQHLTGGLIRPTHWHAVPTGLE